MAAKKKEATSAPKAAEWMYTIVRNPIVTEKSTMGGEHGQVTFKVDLNATKPQIKAAIEGLFGVKVKAVNTSIQKGKTKRFKGVKAFRSDEKKAIITLEEGQTIDVTSGV